LITIIIFQKNNYFSKKENNSLAIMANITEQNLQEIQQMMIKDGVQGAAFYSGIKKIIITLK